MRVLLHAAGHVPVDDVFEPRDVETSPRDVRGDEHRGLTALEVLERLVPALLLELAVQRAHLLAVPFEHVADKVNRLDPVGEDQHAALAPPVVLPELGDVLEQFSALLVLGADVNGLVHVEVPGCDAVALTPRGDGHRRLAGSLTPFRALIRRLDLDDGGLRREPSLGHRANPLGERGAEHQRLSAGPLAHAGFRARLVRYQTAFVRSGVAFVDRESLADLLELLREPEREHTIRLVQHQQPGPLQAERAGAHDREQPPGGAHHKRRHRRWLRELILLFALRRPAVHRDAPHGRRALQFVAHGRDLLRELARRRDDERGGPAWGIALFPRVIPGVAHRKLHRGEEVGEGLAGARGRDAEDVAAHARRRPALSLHGRRSLVPQGLERVREVVGHARLVVHRVVGVFGLGLGVGDVVAVAVALLFLLVSSHLG